MISFKQIFSPILLLILCSLVACGDGKMKPITGGADAELKRCLALANQKKYEETINCLEAYKSRYRGTDAEAEADLMIADSHFRKKDYLLAAETYRSFLEDFPGHPKSDYAYYKGGLAYLKQSPKQIARDQQYLELALKNLSNVVNYYPGSPYYQLAGQAYQNTLARMARKNYNTGRFYYKYGEYRASIPRFIDTVNNYTGSGYDERSLYYVVSAYKKLKLLDQAQKTVAFFEEKYPNSPWLKKAKGVL